ncbi:LMX1B factor, partial [Irena cyanogastra]|nr:LMX1B factor [Irena cyanogastra]
CPKSRRLFPRRCSRCLGALGRSEPILRVLERVFHERCLRCGCCARRLRRGDEFVLRDGRILCRGRCEPERLGSASPAREEARSEDEEGQDSRCSGNSGGKDPDGKDPKRSKRPRTILSSQQRRAFKASFEVSSKPCRKVPERSGTGRDCSGIVPGSFWDCPRIVPGLFWDCSRIVPGLFRDCPGINSEGFFPIPGLLPGIPRDFSRCGRRWRLRRG